jgi:hypothetical protein
MSDDDKIKEIGIKFKTPPGAEPPFLRVVDDYKECNHRYYFANTEGLSSRMVNITYLIREGETEVECGHCHKKLDPMWILKRLAHEETSWANTRLRYQEEMKRLNERSRTKCRKCGHMTDISRN